MCRVRAYWWKDAGIEDFEQLMRVRRATVCSEANAGAGMPAGARKGRDFVRDQSSEREKLVLAAAICLEAHLFRCQPGPGLGMETGIYCSGNGEREGGSEESSESDDVAESKAGCTTAGLEGMGRR